MSSFVFFQARSGKTLRRESLGVDVYAAINAKYGFEIPAEYRRMEKDGFFELKAVGVKFDPLNESYLWVPDAEWMRPQEILEYETPSYQQPGFVPFAFTGAGEPWCWWPPQHSEAVVSLLTGLAGEFDAPNLIGSVLRRFLDYAIYVNEEEEDEARRYFTLWAERLGDYFPASWIDTLRGLAQSNALEWEHGRAKGRGLLHPTRRDELVARDLAIPRLGEQFEWTTA